MDGMQQPRRHGGNLLSKTRLFLSFQISHDTSRNKESNAFLRSLGSNFLSESHCWTARQHPAAAEAIQIQKEK